MFGIPTPRELLERLSRLEAQFLKHAWRHDAQSAPDPLNLTTSSHAQSHSDGDHTAGWATPTGDVDIGDSAAAGSATTHSHSDHQHAHPAPGGGYPQDTAASEADGTATTPARSDHVHKLHDHDHTGDAGDGGEVLQVELNEALIATRARLNFIEGLGIDMTGTDDDPEIDLTIALAGGQAGILGNAREEPSDIGLSEDQVYVWGPFTCLADMEAEAVWGRCRVVAGSGPAKAVIYADDGGSPGAPAALVATSAAATISNTAIAWNKFSFTTPVSLTGQTKYHIGYHSGSTAFRLREIGATQADAAGTNGNYIADEYDDGPPDPFGSGSTSDRLGSMYVAGRAAATVPDHDHTGDTGDGAKISHDSALDDVSADDHHAQAHKDEHDPSDGADALDTANAAEISVVVGAGTGTSHSLARADHVHAINHAITDNHLLTVDGTINSAEYLRATASGVEGRTEAEFKADFNLQIGTDVLAEQTVGIADDNLLEVDGSPNDDEYARFTANGLEGRTEAEFKADFNLQIGTDVLAEQTVGIADDNLLEVDGSPNDDEFARFTANGLEGRTAAEVKTDIAIVHGDVGTSGMKQSIMLLAGSGLVPRTTTACGAAAAAETGTNKVTYTYLPFDTGSDEYACTDKGIPMPENWNAGTFTAKFYWTTGTGDGGAAETIQWAIQLLVLDNDDPLDSAWGAAVLPAADTWIADNDVHISAETGAITPGAPVSAAAGNMLFVQVYRDVSGDDLGADARLLAVRLEYEVSALSA